MRINDIEVANAGGRLRVVAADVGLAGLLRRLGLRSFGRRWLSRMHSVPRSMIAWDSVAPIRDVNPSQVQLSVKQSRLARLHPSELAEIIGDLSSREALAVVGQLDDETAADAFEHLDSETRKNLIDDIGTERAADIIEEMDADDAADLLADLPEEQQTELLAEMNAYTAGELRELVKYDEDTAGGMMTTDYVWIYPHRTTEATIRKIREIAPASEFIYYLYVLDKEDHLLGALSLRTLLLALPTAFIDRIMETDLVTVSPDEPAVDVASTIAKYDLLAVPVVDDARKDARHRDGRRRHRRDHARRGREETAARATASSAARRDVNPEEIVEFGEALARIAATGGGPKRSPRISRTPRGGGVLLEDARWHALATAGTGEIPASGARRSSRSAHPGRRAARHGRRHARSVGSRSSADAPTPTGFLRLTAAAIGLNSPQRRDGARTQDGFWEALLDGAFHDAGAIRDEASTRGIALASAVSCRRARKRRFFCAARARDAGISRAAGTDLGLVERGPVLLLFVPAARTLDASNAKTAASLLPKSASRRKPPLRVSGGIGTVEPPLALRTSVESAEAALAIGRRIYGGGRVAAYEELGAYRLLYEGADPERLRHFASETLAPLRSYDEKHQTELERTLKRYFQSGQNVKTAAAELSVHRHTVFYRLRQIGEISARSFDSPHDQLTLRLAVAIDELYNSK